MKISSELWLVGLLFLFHVSREFPGPGLQMRRLLRWSCISVYRRVRRFCNSALEFRGVPGEMEEGKNPARTIPTSNPDPDPDQKQGGLGVWRVTRQGIRKRPRALGPVRPTSGAPQIASLTPTTPLSPSPAASAASPLARGTATHYPLARSD